MPRTKKARPEPRATVVNGPAVEVLTLAEAAAYLRLLENDVLAAIATQGLPGRLVSGEWRFLKSALRDWLSPSTATDAMPKAAAQLAAAGSLGDDPDLEDMVEEIYRRRGRPITEDGSYRLFHGLDSKDFAK